MEFEREHYVRVYTPITDTGRILGFWGRCLRDAILQRVNLAGVMRLDPDLASDNARAVAGAIGCEDVEWVRKHLPPLLELNVVRIQDGHLIFTKYHEGQYFEKHERSARRALLHRKYLETRDALDAGLLAAPPHWMRSYNPDGDETE